MSCILWLAEIAEGQARRVGGKGLNLGLLCRAGFPVPPGFCVTTAGFQAFIARTLAVELAPERIRVNNVAPDIAPTPGMMGIRSEADGVNPTIDPLNVQVSIPMARLGATTDISNAVVFLASGLSSYVTGTTLHPDGGTWASAGWFNWPDEGFGNTMSASVLEFVRNQV